MAGYATCLSTIRVGNHDYSIRALRDRLQYDDADGAAARAGISSAQWCLFGQLWPSGKVLAEAMTAQDLGGRRILELGCGLGLSSLVLARRGADITASDHHPLAESFLADNAERNALHGPIYRDLPWDLSPADLGRFDLIIASDVLYERAHAGLLAQLLLRHARPQAEILIADPGRGNSGRLSRALTEQGYSGSELRLRFNAQDTPPFRGRLLRYQRLTGAVAATSPQVIAGAATLSAN